MDSRLYIKTNPKWTPSQQWYPNDSKDTTLPEVTTSLQPIDRESGNLEAEKGEITVAPDVSTIHKINGKPHSKGGTPLLLEPGSFIFSKDRSLAIPKKAQEVFGLKTTSSSKQSENTPAKLLERVVDLKHHNQMSAILQDDKNRDMTARNTAQLMIKKNKEKVGQVAFLQEAKKDFRDGTPQISQGTQPIFSQQVKDQITTEDQYMQHGGYIPKAQMGRTVRGRYNMYTPEQLKQIQAGKLAAPGYYPTINNPFGIQHNNGNTYGQIIDNNLNEFKDFNWWMYGNNPNARPQDFQQGYTQNINPQYSGFGFNNTDQTPLNNIDNKLGNYTATRPLPYEQIQQEELDPLLQDGTARPYSYNKQPYFQIKGRPALFTPVTNRPKLTGLDLPLSKPLTQMDAPPLTSIPQPQQGLNPGTFNPKGGVYTDQRVGFNTGQVVDLVGSSLINGLRKNIYPRRNEDSFTPLELQQLNPNQALQENSNNYLQAARLAAVTGATPAQAALQQQAFTQGISNANSIRNNYDSQNVQIANNQNQYNNQGYNTVRGRNVQNNSQYNQQVDATIGRANDEKVSNATDFLNRGLSYYGQNQQFQNSLNALQQFPQVNPDGSPVLDSQGRQVYNTPYSYKNGNFRFNGVNGFNMVNGQRQNTFSQEIEDLKNAIKNGSDPRSQSLDRATLVKLLTSKQTPFQNRYGGSIQRRK